MAASITLSAVVAFCWLAVDSPAGLVVWACVYGMTSSAFIAVSKLVPCKSVVCSVLISDDVARCTLRRHPYTRHVPIWWIFWLVRCS